MPADSATEPFLRPGKVILLLVPGLLVYVLALPALLPASFVSATAPANTVAAGG
jgi:hypothetical protein